MSLLHRILRNIASATYEFFVNRKVAHGGSLVPQAGTTYKKSGITKDGNLWTPEITGEPANPHELFQSPLR